MSRRSRLAERLDEMQAEIDELSAKVDKPAVPVKYEPIPANPPISDPLDAHGLLAEASYPWQFYNEDMDIYSSNPNRYL